MATIAKSLPSLTQNDASVLQALFDAESSPSSGITVDQSLPSWPPSVTISQEDLSSLKIQETDIVRRLQRVTTPDRELIDSTLEAFNSLVNEFSTYPPAYTNRAQVLRILVDHAYNEKHPHSIEAERDDALFTPEAAELSSCVFADLGQAIKFATPASPADPVSSVQARLLADAHTHRGYLLLKAARVKKNRLEQHNLQPVGPERLQGLNADQLEEMASRDFFLGGRYGNKVGQQLAVQTNPYAKMCGAIVKEAMRKEVEG
ncbi:hypothetical protein N7462_010690 [Penicillium macrosclerotiorum]|uniref:uncharacterized protein n=1 Tax=Penicillium macrosclerotiorum TaxID=303699 RepID=UPI002546826D|nr:uncharacterized protein N7462_010690 [Penicillium macrosclerotiorum]KAJ5669620.1 hypothetical protein N7462_010690 [Penicillium macrosclerotiorum]